jgi:hypothetical protein
VKIFYTELQPNKIINNINGIANNQLLIRRIGIYLVCNLIIHITIIT